MDFNREQDKESKTKQFAQEMEVWLKSEDERDIIDCNIRSILGIIKNPFYTSLKCGEEILTTDTIPYINTLIEINDKRFITFDSQPSLKFTRESHKPYDNEFAPKIKQDGSMFRTKDGKYFYAVFQKAYCYGYICNKILEQFVKKIGARDYETFYVNATKNIARVNKERINVTYVTNGETNFNCTNLVPVTQSNETSLYFLNKSVSQTALEQLKRNFTYVYVIGFNYDTGKNIYKDILECLN